MASINEMLSGTGGQPTEVHAYLADTLLPLAVETMNTSEIPSRLRLFDDEALPTNQRNLTDFRTRLGLLLEYELARTIYDAAQPDIDDALQLMYVIANRFPDLEFRTLAGGRGVRIEVKSIDILAEEKAANFDTLIKDIRKGLDFVVVMLWRWVARDDGPSRAPRVEAAYVLDAYTLAQMRDCYWLNKPPAGATNARQGFDIRYAVNCSGDNYNEEEGNLGKLMRLFDSSMEDFLPGEVNGSRTLQTYYEMCDSIYIRGLLALGTEFAQVFCAGQNESIEVIRNELPIRITAGGEDRRLVVIGDVQKPTRAVIQEAIAEEGASAAVALNGKFSWWAFDEDANEAKRGTKPRTAISHLGDLAEAAAAPHPAED